MIKTLTLTIAGLAALVSAQLPVDDLVSTLEQFDDISFGLYSGYIPISNTKKKLHYMAALSKRDPKTDPVIIWFNGGPGCTSMLGFSQENGPYALNDDDTIFRVNDYSWNNEATMIYIESPAGVGYSVCGDAKECAFTDENSADDNLAVVLSLYQTKFPDFQKNDLYIAGESYAGIYIPQLVKRIDKYITDNAQDPNVFKPALKGFMVGNGVTHWKYDAEPAAIEQAYWFGLVDDALYNQMRTCDFTYYDFDGDTKLNQTCKDLKKKYDSYMNNIQPYDLFGKCYFWPTQKGPQLINGKMVDLADDASLLQERDKYLRVVDYANFKYRDRPDYQQLKDAPSCGTYDGPLLDYFNKDSVKLSLKIDSSITKFQLCSDINYSKNRDGTFAIYQQLTQPGAKYRILKYSGDSDGVVPTQGTMKWIDELGLKVTKPFRSYDVGGNTAGWVVEYENNFTFATIHGAGHMAPQWKRQQTYHAIFNWLKGQEM